MKNKYLNHIMVISLGSISLLTSPITVAGPDDNSNCSGFSLSSTITMLSPDGPAIGVGVATMDNGAMVEINAFGEITESKTDEDGVIHMRVTEVDDWGFLGTSIGMDKLKLTPTAVRGEYDMSIKVAMQGESGAIEELHGHYRGEGSASFITGTISHSGTGIACNLPF